jgi:hypothetical protein
MKWHRELKRAKWIPFIATGALLAFPASGWLVKAELGAGMSANPLLETAPGPLHAKETAYATQAIGSGNVQVAIAHAIRSTNANAQGQFHHAEAILALRPQFGHEPALYANGLRYWCLHRIHLSRDEEALLSPPKPKSETNPKHSPKQPNTDQNRPETLQAYEEAAQTGERIDTPKTLSFPPCLLWATLLRTGTRMGLRLWTERRKNRTGANTIRTKWKVTGS